MNTIGYLRLRLEFFQCLDSEDKWGSAMEWLFAIADELFHAGEKKCVPSAWNFQHAYFCSGGIYSEAADIIATLKSKNKVTVQDILLFGRVLFLYSCLLELNGENY